MSCYHPVKGYRKAGGGFTLRKSESYMAVETQVPCGQCMGCRVDRSREWAARCYHEASQHESNEFVTLTYSPEHLPQDCSLNIRHLQLFMKRLRKRYGKVRFFACGEYGGRTLRPHYHALLFGLSLSDKVPYKHNHSGMLYNSAGLTDCWGLGHVTTGDCSFSAAAYVARYSLKKITGRDAREHYQRLDAETGELIRVKPEFLVMSRRPGIGYTWFQKYKGDCYPSDFVTVDGRKVRVPGYYDRQLAEEERDPIKAARKRNSWKHQANNTPERLHVRETVHASRMGMLNRDLEE